MWRWFPSSVPLTVTRDRLRTTFRTTNRWTTLPRLHGGGPGRDPGGRGDVFRRRELQAAGEADRVERILEVPGPARRVPLGQHRGTGYNRAK